MNMQLHVKWLICILGSSVICQKILITVPRTYVLYMWIGGSLLKVGVEQRAHHVFSVLTGQVESILLHIIRQGC
jgi:hypothetical protein